MKEYPIKPFTNNYQLLWEYVKDFDRDLNSLINLIDFRNPNYIVLNKEYIEKGPHFFSNKQLSTGQGPQYLNILNIDNENHLITINLNNMQPHWVLINHWGQDATVYVDGVMKDTLSQGFAIYHNGRDANGEIQYSIISLDSSGAYYVLSNITTTQEQNQNYITYHWQYYENAIDDIGTKYIFVFAHSYNRYIYHDSIETEIKENECLKKIQDFNSFIVTYSYNYSAESEEFTPILATQNGTFWTTAQNLGHDIIILNSDNSWEEVICDEHSYNDHIVENYMPNARSIITTNLQSCAGINFYINFY